MTSEEIKAARKAIGMTQREFADAIGGNINTLRHWEQGVYKVNKFAIKEINRLMEEKGVVNE
ncbi:MAG: helix-turn-helix domain-containing protein [Aeromonadaceae bacterium]